MSIFGEFSKSRVALEKKRRRIKSSCARCFEAAKLFLIDELKLEQFFLLSLGVPDEKLFSVVEVVVSPQTFSHADRHFRSLRIKAARWKYTEVDDEFFLQVFSW